MNPEALVKFVIFLFFFVLCLSLETIFSKVYYKLTKKYYKSHHYSIGKYVYFLILPTLVTLYFLKAHDSNFFMVFVGFALLGTFFEGVIGFFYHIVIGEKLWTYHRYSIASYTSLLSMPMWGMAGLICYLFLQVFI